MTGINVIYGYFSSFGNYFKGKQLTLRRRTVNVLCSVRPEVIMDRLFSLSIYRWKCLPPGSKLSLCLWAV